METTPYDKKYIVQLIMLILFVIILGAIIYFLSFNKPNPHPVQISKTFTTPAVSTPTVTPEDMNKKYVGVYRDTKYGFSIYYPTTAKIYNAPYQRLTFMDQCGDDSTILCLFFSPETTDNPNYIGSSLSIHVLKDVRTNADCIQQTPSETGTISSKQINGIPFSYGMFGQGAAGHLIDEDYYHTFHSNACFEIRLTLEQTSPNAYLTPMPENKKVTVFAQLNQILSTFTFSH